MTSLMRAQIGLKMMLFNAFMEVSKRLVACQTNMLDTCARVRWHGSLHELVEAFQAEGTCLKFVA